jgi:glycosyltransferase involved in cell wall biosynthesis
MRVGIVVPAFDVAAYIGIAIESVIAQSHPDWALVVVDDGSRDATAQVAAGFADPRIKLLRQPNAGVSAARNAGLAALGPVDAVLFLDADDWLAPDALARLCPALTAGALTAGAVAACGAYAFVGAAARPGDAPIMVKRRPCGAGGDVLTALLTRNLFANGGHVLLRRAAVAQAGGFLPGLAYGEDWQFFVRIALQGRVAVAPGPPVLFVRRRAGGAYLGRATDAAAHDRCTAAIYEIPGLAERFGPRLAALRRRTDAERDWVIGRELLRHGRQGAGLRRLWRSLCARPGWRRAALFAAAVAQRLLPARWQGPFRADPADARGRRRAYRMGCFRAAPAARQVGCTAAHPTASESAPGVVRPGSTG